MSYKASDIANKILAKATNDFNNLDSGGSLISNMKLQKMLYYMQGYYLAFFDEDFFDEDIEAWMYGPVVPSIYDSFKTNGNAGISYTKETISLNKEEEALFEEVYRVYSQYSAIGLMNMTHSEKPWNSVPPGIGSIISKSVIKSYFKDRING